MSFCAGRCTARPRNRERTATATTSATPEQGDTSSRENDNCEMLVRIMAAKLKIPLEPDWVPGIAQQLCTTLALADMIDAVALSDDAQPAPVFTP